MHCHANKEKIMTTIRTECPKCNTERVNLAPDDILLVVIPDSSNRVHPESHYAFTCPQCEKAVKKPADERIVNLLAEAGVKFEIRNEDGSRITPDSDKPAHPEEPPAGPEFTHDDILNLHIILQQDDWFEELLLVIEHFDEYG